MSRGEDERLRDIADAVETIKAHVTRVRTEPRLHEDPLLHGALLYEFVVLGEAVKHLSAETRARAPEVPWQSVAGLRDLIAHEYFRIDIKRVLDIVERDLPALEQAISRLLEPREGQAPSEPEN
ncbi:MAG: HepT-like ribonuclease domain-containing protein [Solirubrobacteraceae bacterium]